MVKAVLQSQVSREIESVPQDQEGQVMLTDDAKREIESDFQEWSGGFLPHEATEKEVITYVECSAPMQWNELEVLAHLLSLHSSG